jgi:alkanesulfonate monooxygenase SsuD/methylene tetrahydromethanopterin reductase-like flavin-dependent oxidoreductase (luciferase family)
VDRRQRHPPGPHFTVENARIYTLPEGEIPILVSAFGEAALQVAMAHGDG